MSKNYWQQKLQSSLQQSLQTVNSTVSSISSDGAARLKALSAAETAAPEAQPPPQQQFLRLPLESARKLRFYDRPDLSELVEQHARDKAQLTAANAALRQALKDQGAGDDAELNSEVQRKVEELQRVDEGVATVLLTAAQAEVARLRSAAEAAATAQASLQHLSERARDTSSTRQGAEQEQELQAARQEAETAKQEAEAARQEVEVARQDAAAAQQVAAELAKRHAARVAELETRLAVATQTQPDAAAGAAGAPAGGRTPDRQQGSPVPPFAMDEAATPRRVGFDEAMLAAASPEKGDESAASPPAELLHMSSAPVDISGTAARQLITRSVPNIPNLGWSLAGLEGRERHWPYPPLRRLQEAEEQATAALMGKIQRMEKEKQNFVEEITDLSAQVVSFVDRLESADQRAGAAEAALVQTREELEETQATSDRRLQELRSRVGASSTQAGEMLREAQAICDEAECRAEAAEKSLQQERAARSQMDSEAAQLRRQCEQAKAVAAKGSRDSEWGRDISKKLEAAEARANVAEKARQTAAAASEQQAGELRRLLARAEAEQAALERRLADAGDAEGRYLTELRDLEAAAADREELAVRAAALEERLDELRAEQGQLATYKQLAAEAEAAKARVEGELLQTAKIASSMEARLRESQAAADAARSSGATADRRAYEAEQRVGREVEARMAAIGPDRGAWPAVAREEAERLDAKAAGLTAMLARLQAQLEDAAARSRQDARKQYDLQRQLDDAKHRAERVRRESGKEADAAKEALAAAEADIQRLRGELEPAHEAAAAHAAARLATSPAKGFQRGGGGLLGNGHHATASEPRPARPPRSPQQGGDDVGDEGPHTPRSVRTAGRSGSGYMGRSNDSDTGDAISAVDLVYLKNVLLKFIEAQSAGKAQERDALLPAVATLLRATPAEFRALRSVVAGGSWWPAFAAG